MPAYRFCRTDDIPALVQAWNACCRPHFPAEPELTEERFKQAAREIGLWTGSSMLATEGGEPVAVLLTARREEASLVHSIGVRPGHERHGHGRHLLDSLRRKAAILGPQRIVAEVPLDLEVALAFFRACGFRAEARFADWVLESVPPAAAARADLSATVALEELDAAGCLKAPSPCAWSRSPSTLRSRSSALEGRAVVSDRRVEAWTLAGSDGGAVEVAGFGHAGDLSSRALLGYLLHELGRSAGQPVRLRRVAEGELAGSVLESWGFRRVREFAGLSMTASAG